MTTVPIHSIAGALVGFGKNSTLKNGLKTFRNYANEVLQNFIFSENNARVEVVTRLASEVIRVIDHFEEVYRNELNYTIDQLNPVIHKAFEQLAFSIDHFVNQVKETNQNMIQGAQQITLAFPFSKQQSQFTTIKPRFFVVTDRSAKSIVTVNGVFPGIARRYTPTLKFNSVGCKLLHSSTQELQFEVSHAIFKEPPHKKQFSLITGTLNIPWNAEGFLQSRVNTCFQVTLYALPRIAGTITKMKYTYKMNALETIRMEKAFPYEHVVNKSHPYKAWYHPDPGYHFDTTKPPIVEIGFSTPTRIEFSHDHLAVVIEWNKTKSNCVSATVKVTQMCTRLVEEVKEYEEVSPIEIAWGETKTLSQHPDKTLHTVCFEDCRGNQFEWVAPFRNIGILKIRMDGPLPQIYASPPKDVHAFMNVAQAAIQYSAKL
jgi:hypothetical protein